MQRIDRRQLLKTAAAVTAGAAAGAIGLPPMAAAAAQSGGLRHPGSGTGAAPKLAGMLPPAPTASTTYAMLTGSDFKPTESADGWVQNDLLYIYPAAAVSGDFRARIPVPNGAVITEAVAWVVNNDASGMNFFAPYRFAWDGSFLAYGFANLAAVDPALVQVTIPVTPVVVDNTLNSYNFLVTFGVTNGTQRLYAARVGWLLEPGLTTFPDPRRVYHQATSTSTPGEAFLLNIDATTKAASQGGGPTGVPAGAKAAFCAVQTYESGVMTLYPAGTGDTGLANWAGPGTNGNLQLLYMLVPLGTGANAGKFNIHNRFNTKQIYVDVWGYLV